ncbi:hypothetical protein LCGC14_0198890 [marine sediment metagenome]|uniref:Uncharacterized protein n=1 Tax=marine sediment metagenome TaxID=412755 RepID=A0A0F9X3R3_9ZZZZ
MSPQKETRYIIIAVLILELIMTAIYWKIVIL